MTLQLGETAPDFTVASTEGNIQFHEWLGDDWAVLFSHPTDYTPSVPQSSAPSPSVRTSSPVAV